MNIIDQIRKRAARQNKRIVFPESNDMRVLQAAAYLIKHNVCSVTLVGNREKINQLADRQEISLGKEIMLYDPQNHEYRQEFSKLLYERRKHKGISRSEVNKLIKNPLYFAALMVATGRADGAVAGSIATTGEVIKSALQCIGLKPKTSIVSSTFLMAMQDEKVFTYADCGVVPYPDANQLADIAIESARTHELLSGEDARVAMLSFSTKGSARHESVDLVRKGLEKAIQKAPKMVIDGELQFDAALVPEVARKKAPNSAVAGRANVFIFPNLDAGNSAYKITERLGGATATGPILQGLAKPMMDLSRGCSWQDIVNAACVAVLMDDSTQADNQTQSFA